MRLDTKQKRVDLGAVAFFQGAQGIPLEQTLREIVAVHDIERAEMEQESARREKPLEARVEQLEHERPHVDAAWAEVVHRLGFHSPPVAMAFIAGVLGFGALGVDAVLMGPGLDAIGIANPILQFCAAFGLAALSATLFHLAYETFGGQRHSVEIVMVRRGLAGFAVVALLAWGVLRGYQVKFAADIAGSPLGRFLGAHPILASLFFCFVTLAAPLVGAAAFHDAAPRINDWLIWKRAKRRHDELHSWLTSARKKLEEERVARHYAVSRLEAQQRTWEAAAGQQHQQGCKNGARQEPQWLVPMKATGWSLGGLALGGLAGPFFPPLYFLLPAGTWLAAYLHYRRARHYPTYDEFKRMECARFVATDDTSRTGGRRSPELLPPQEDER